MTLCLHIMSLRILQLENDAWQHRGRSLRFMTALLTDALSWDRVCTE